MNTRNIQIGDWVTANNLVGQVVEKGLDSQKEELWVIWSGDSLPMNELAASLQRANYEGEDLAGTELPNGRVNRLVYEYGVKAEVYLDHKRKPELWTLENLNQELNNDKPQSVTPPFNEPTKLSLSQIRCDGGTQSRAAIHQTTVDEYAQDYKNGANFPPIIVFYDGNCNWLADGFHREKAALKAGLTEIAAIVKQGTRRDAVLYSVGANALHGLRRTNADKRRAVMTLLEDEEWSHWSDREIARRCCVNNATVSRIRASLLLCNSENPNERTYTTKHGTQAKMNTANIGKGKSSEPLAPSAQEKELTLKSSDKEGISPSEEKELTTPSEEKEGISPTSKKENNQTDNAPPDNAPPNIRDLLSEGDRVRIKDNHYFGGQFGIVTVIPNRDSAIVEFSPGERELIKLEDFDLSTDNAIADNATTNNVPADNEPPNIRNLLAVGDRARIKDDHEFGGQFGIVTFIPDRHRAVVEFAPGNRKIIQLEDFDFSATQKPEPQRPQKKEIIIKEGLNYKAGWPCKWYVEVEEKTYKELQEYREKVGTITIDAAICRFLENENNQKPINSDDICLCLTNNLEQLTDDRVRFVVTAIAQSRPKIICQVAETVRADYLDMEDS